MAYGSIGLSHLFVRSFLYGYKMTVVDPGILTQSFSKSGHRAARVAKDNSPCMLSALIREKIKTFVKYFQQISLYI